jgi:Zn-dependent peptidase ImmA (M78 family)
MREFLMDQGADALPMVRSANLHEGVTAIADRIRLEFGFNRDWASAHRTWTEALSALREAVESSGVLVVVNGVVGNDTHWKLDVEEFRGFVLVDDLAPLVFINGADGKAAQMFTLAHELAHVFFGSSAAFDLRRLQPADDATEKACNAVAAEFLVPEATLREMWSTASRSRGQFQEVARYFKVSEIVAARRLLDLGLISSELFFAIYQEYTDRVRVAFQAGGGGDFYATQNLRLGRRFARAVIQATREGKLLFNDAYRLTGLRGRTFEQYAERLGAGASH